ncbi:putative transcription factor MYC/MYB [Arabidopsis thaliana]
MWFRYFGVDKCNFVLLNSIRILRFEEAYNDEQSFALVDDMTLQAPFLGQGIVGEVASTGNHQWLFSDTLFQNQFLSGFKTIAIIPLGSSGVVQLGSTQKILESTKILEQTTRALQETC